MGDVEIREAHKRIVEVFQKKPSAGHGTMRASGRLEDGLVCVAGANGTEVTMDMKKAAGGGESAPPPGFYIRAGLIGCVAIGIKLTAAREGIPIEAIDVDVEMDFDDFALFGLGANSAAPLETRLSIRIDSSASQDVLDGLVKRALAADPYFLAIQNAQKISATVARVGA